MKDHVKQADLLKKEAGQLLVELNLAELLNKYGQVHITGSYEYDLMTRRDIDICVEVVNPSIELLFSMGKDLALLPGVGSMYYRNELELQTPGNPRAMFWCVGMQRHDGHGMQKWNLDILVSSPEEVERILAKGVELLRKLDRTRRERVLKIKGPLSATGDYGKAYKSTDIYEAVIEGGVENLAGWKAWWREK
ncbi:MAG: hypothetical protein JW839_05510 [Candidatus Lokiarchaeota archaeon]|nr:hypothetical protein [Candidatus Lokiarchaeota archaeon]